MIKLSVEKTFGDFDEGTSKFFGAPTMPEEWLSDGTVGDEDFFFCQIKLSELAQYGKSDLLLPKGFLYIFLTKENNESYIPNVRLTKEEPDTLIDDFNFGFDFLGDTDAEFSIDFKSENEQNETALFIEENDNIILLQYDPLDDNMPSFLADTEKKAIFKISKSDFEKLDFSNVKFELV